MAMVNPMINIQNIANVKDSRWLTLEVCREFQRNKCNRSETECKFAHPPPHVEVQNGRVTCCFDSIKGKCQRKEPPCKYLHPPQHLREQLLQNGRNNLILKNLQMQALAAGVQPMVPGMIPTVIPYETGAKPIPGYPGATVLQSQFPGCGVTVTEDSQTAVGPGQSLAPSTHQQLQQMSPQSSPYVSWGYSSSPLGALYAAHPYLMQNAAAFNPYMSPAGIAPMSSVMPTMEPSMSNQVATGVMPTQIATQAAQKMHRADRLEGMAMPGMVPYVKRQAHADSKSGIPVYQPGTGTTAAYQQAALAAMQLQQPFVPVTIAGHPPSVPRF